MKTMTILLLALLICPVQAKTITVDSPSGNVFDIQAAIDQAKDGDTVMILPGVYQGQKNDRIELRGKAITLQSQDPNDSSVVTATVIQRPVSILVGRDVKTQVSGLTFSGNETVPAIKAGGKLTISKCVIKDNLAGGLRGADLEVEGCTFENNVALRGGGIFLDVGGHLNVRHCVFRYNRAEDRGGAIFTNGSDDYRHVNCLFVANHAGQLGGAIYSDESGAMRNCTLVGNSAGLAGGSLCLAENAGVSFANTIVAHNTDSAIQGRSIALYSSSTGRGGIVETIQRSAQALEEVATSLYSCLQIDSNEEIGPFAGISGTINVAPQFIRMPSDGGDGWGDNPETPDIDEGVNDDYGDLHLQKTSPCVDAGEPGSGFKTPVLDLDGNLRVTGARIDMGAYETVMSSYRVIQPVGGETWSAGSQHTVTWESRLSSGTVDVLLSTDDGQSWESLAVALPDEGTYQWTVADHLESLACRVQVLPSDSTVEAHIESSGLFSIRIPTEGVVTNSPWPSLGGNYDRSGLGSWDVPENMVVAWVFDTNAPVLTSVTVGAEGRIHIACDSGKLYTLDQSGKQLWCYENNMPFCSAPSVGSDGTIYVGDRVGRLHAIDPTGQLRWTYDAKGFVYASSAVGQDGTVFLASQDGTLSALSANGTKLWDFATWAPFGRPGAIVASPAVGQDGTVYIGGLFDPNLYALDAATGEVQWICSFVDQANPSNPKSDGAFASPVVAPDGTIYQTLLHDTHLYAIDPNSGQILWVADMSVPVASEEDYVSTSGWSEPALGPDGTIYVASDDATLRAVAADGQIEWVAQLGSPKGFTLAVGLNGLVCAAGDDGALFIVNESGDIVSQFQGEGSLSYPVITAANQLIVSDAHGKVWAIGRE
jgi:predicted outer membrane repeat protein